MQCKLDWFLHALGAWANLPWALAVAAWWLSSRSRRQAFWAWLTDEHFYKGFGFLGLLWPQLERKRVWPEVMEEAKVAYLERLEKMRQFRGDRLPKWWVALANIRFLQQMAFLVAEMSRTSVVATVRAIAFRKRRRSLEMANNHPLIVNATCRIEASGVLTVEPPREQKPPSTQG
jgi:hypothetical protein